MLGLSVPPLPWPAVAAVALAGFVVYWLAWTIYARTLHPLAKYPGPFLASVSRLWIADEVRRANAEKTQRDLHARLGPIIRIAPNEVAISDPEAIKTIYGINSGFTKTDFYSIWTPTWCKYPDHFSSLDERVHASRRKITNNLYSMSNIARSEESIDLCTDVLMRKLREHAASGRSLDVAKWAQMYAFDVVGQLFFSRAFGFMETEKDYRGYIRSLDTLLPFLAITSVIPSYLRTACMISGALFPPIFRALRSIKDIEGAAELCIAERRALLETGADVPRPDILSSLFATMHEKGEKVDFGLTEVKVEVYVALFAGSDTTAAAVSSVLYHLMKNRAAYDKLTKEIDDATAAGTLSTPHVRYKEAAALPYLDACCKEGMRMHPSVGLSLPRVVPAGGSSICGAYFPAGTRVGVNAAVVHFDKGVFGPDADDYNPDRWMRSTAANMDRYMFQFGAGSRTCIGKNISLCEMYKMIPELLRTFHMELVEPATPWTTHNFWFNKPSGVTTKLTLRDAGSKQ